MTEPRTVQHVRVLTSEQMRELSLHNFKAYRAKVLRTREEFHHSIHPQFDEHTPTESEVQIIRTLDWLSQEVGREWARREEIRRDV